MNGVLVVDKPIAYTSRDVVNIVSRKLGIKKVGHTGTLDPMASGVLVLCIGDGLKLVELMTNHDKEYVAKVQLGIETDTLDCDGIVVKRIDNMNIAVSDVDKVLEKFIGNIRQEVPIYSSVKVDGKKLYEYARNNINVKLPIRDVSVYSLKRVSDIEDNFFYLKCHVGKGTYIRSLVRDIGISLGGCATMMELRRVRVGNFTLDDAYTLDDIKNDNFKILDLKEVIDLREVVVSESLEKKIRNGQVLDRFFDDEMVKVVSRDGVLLAIYMEYKGRVKPYRMFV